MLPGLPWVPKLKNKSFFHLFKRAFAIIFKKNGLKLECCRDEELLFSRRLSPHDRCIRCVSRILDI